MPRDEKRIEPFLAEVEKLWKQNPDWRFGQLFVNVLGRDPFYIEDEKSLEIIKKSLEIWKNGN